MVATILKILIMTAIEFNCHFSSLQKKLLPFAYKLTNNLEDAKDLIQETALRAFNNKDKFETGTNFRAWVTTIMRTLDTIYRKPFQLFFEGYKYEEIAEDMNLPIGTVKSRIFFARQKLMQTINLSYAYDTTAVLN